MKNISLLIIFSVMIVRSFAIADEAPQFKWVCSASTIDQNGVTENILNVVFIDQHQETVLLYELNGRSLYFQQSLNPLDNAAEYFIGIKDNSTGEELFRAYGNDDAAFGLKWVAQRLAAYCRPMM